MNPKNMRTFLILVTALTVCCVPAGVRAQCGSGGDCLGMECRDAGECSAACPGEYWVCEINNCVVYTPIVIDLEGDGFLMTSASGGVIFDMLGNGRPARLAWTAAGSDDAWLALDRNGNGRIDDGKELFGSFTPLPWGGRAANGFEALGAYDSAAYGGNGDGVIDAKDAVYLRLLLWVDKNHNGISELGELFLLPQLGLRAIDCRYQRGGGFVDQYGNGFRLRAKVWDAKHADIGKWAYDVFLLPDRTAPAIGFSGYPAPRLLATRR